MTDSPRRPDDHPLLSARPAEAWRVFDDTYKRSYSGSWVDATTTGAVAVMTASWPAGSGVRVAIVAGTFAGHVVSRRSS